MCGTFGDDFSPLPGHEVQELVDKEGRRERLDAPSRYGDELATYRAPELTGVASECRHYPVQALEAHCVGAAE